MKGGEGAISVFGSNRDRINELSLTGTGLRDYKFTKKVTKDKCIYLFFKHLEKTILFY